MHCVLRGFYWSVLFPQIGRAGTPTNCSLELTIGRIGRNMVLLQTFESSIRVDVMQFYVYAVAIVNEDRRISAQAGRPRLDSARPPASAVWKSEVGRASDRPFSPLLIQSCQCKSLCASDCLPGSVTLPVAQQSPGSWEREQIRHRHQNLGDVDHGLTNDLHAGRSISVRPSRSTSPPCGRLPRSPRHGKMSTESRKPRGSTMEGCLVRLPHWNVTQSLMVTNWGQDRHGLDLRARLVG